MVSGRAQTILDRFPVCLGLDDPEKAFAFMVDRLAVELDVVSSNAGRIRRNHRLGSVDNEWDLQELIDLHEFPSSTFEPLTRRLDAVRAAGQELIADPGNAALATEVRDRLLPLLGVPADSFPAFPDEAPEVTTQRLGNALLELGRYRSEMGQRRRMATELIDVHATGNATVSALLRATTALLALDIAGEIQHHPDGYWHFATCRDRLQLIEQPGPDSELGPQPVAPVGDLVALEENPFQPADVQPAARRSGQHFAITRAGWEEVPVTVRVIGIGDRCAAPMVVNTDTGAGVIFTGMVGDGEELRFERSGLVTLDGLDVGPRSFSFVGGVFAGSPEQPNAFVWADADEADPTAASRTATFALTGPVADGFAREPGLPHGGGLLDAPTLLPDKTRWAFFVREAHFGTLRFAEAEGEGDPEGEPRIASPTHDAARFDRSVFDPTETDGSRAPSADVGFEWEEREAFALCLWLPARLAELDTEGAEPLREQIRVLVDRYRAAGVHVRVKYADEHWTLGVGVIRDPDSLEPAGTIVAGTTLSPAPTEPDA